MKTATKSILLLLAAYASSLVAAAVTVGAVMAVLNPHNCSDLSQALLVLWVAIAAVFCVSLVMVGFVAWRLQLGMVGRLALVGTYGILLLATYIVVAFGLMLAFNC